MSLDNRWIDRQPKQGTPAKGDVDIRAIFKDLPTDIIEAARAFRNAAIEFFSGYGLNHPVQRPRKR
jgi:hypothetical protein